MFSVQKKEKCHDILGRDKTIFFGKLPLLPEFVRYGEYDAQNDVQLAKFEQWFEEGFSKVNREMFNDLQTHRRLGLHHCYILSFGLQQKPMLGYIHDCHDKLGRYYPFVIVRKLENTEASEYFQLGSVLYEEFFTQLAGLNEAYWYENSTQKIELLLQPLLVSSGAYNAHAAINLVFAQLTNISFETFWRQITMARVSLPYEEVIANLVIALYKKSKCEHWQLLLPLPKYTAGFIHVAFWLKLIGQFIALSEAKLQIFWSYEKQRYGEQLTIYWGEPTTDLLRKTLEREHEDVDQYNIYQHYYGDQTLLEKLSVKPETSLVQVLHLWNQIDWEHELCLA